MSSNSQAEIIRQTLVDYLSSQPDRTALNRDCLRVINQAVGREVNRSVIGPIKRELGITHQTGSLSGKLGDTFVTYWTLPQERSSKITGADRGVAEAMVDAVSANDSGKVGSLLEQVKPRINQVLIAALQLAAEYRAEAEQ